MDCFFKNPWRLARPMARLLAFLLLGLVAGSGWADDGRAAAARRPGTQASACPPPPPTATPKQLRAAPRDRGFLWRITRDGHSSHLFGTLHVGQPGWQRLGPATAAALRASDVLALEVDPHDPSLLQAMAEVQPAAALPEPLRQRLADALRRACVEPAAMVGLHPVLQAATLTVLEARWLGLDPLFGLEAVLAAQARAAGVPLVALETAAQQSRALVPADESQALELIAQSLQQLEDGSGRRVLQRLAEVWQRGDLAALANYEQWCECVATEAEREFARRLNDARNPALADGLQALHAKGQRVFAAVGALHMTGEQSLPQLMRQRGFVVQRLTFGD